MIHRTIPLAVLGAVAWAPVAHPSSSLLAQAESRVAIQGEVSHSAFDRRRPRESFAPHPATQHPSRRVTAEDLSDWVSTLSNWGRWGAAGDLDLHPALPRNATDQKGTLNLITPENATAAARLVTEGRVVSLSAFLGIHGFEPAVDTWSDGVAAEWWPIDISEGSVSANDAIKFGVHDGIVSHMTALCHSFGLRSDPSVRLPEYGPFVGVDGPNYPHQNSVFYNGYPYLVDESGCQYVSIDAMGDAYTTRAILYDLPLLNETDWLDPTTPIFVEDLEAWEEYAGVRAGPGDVVIIRTGRWAQREQEGPWYSDRGGAGLHASALHWLRERDVAVLASDAWNDVLPSGVEGVARPIHQMALVVMGLPLVNNAYPEDAAEVARSLGRWEFMLTWKNLDIPGGSGSPWNSVAVF